MFLFSNKKFSTSLILIMAVLIMAPVITACQLTRNSEEQTDPGESSIPFLSGLDSPTAQPFVMLTPVPEGFSRANPIPFSNEIVSLDNWDLRVIDSIRGDEAWQLIHLANQFNEPAGDSWEYLLLKLWIKNKSNEADKSQLSLHITGDNLITHYSFNANVVAPEPWLDTYLPGEDESEGWQAYRIREGESNLMLIVEDVFEFEQPKFFLAVEEGAKIKAEANALTSITPTQLGVDASEPVPFGQIATNEDWQVVVQQLISGEEAWQIVYEANQFNDPPPKDMMYLIVQVRVSYIGLDEQGSTINDDAFTIMDSSGTVYEPASIVSPDPELFFELFSGGVVEGLITYLVPKTGEGFLLIFDSSPYSNSGFNKRYLSIVLGGR